MQSLADRPHPFRSPRPLAKLVTAAFLLYAAGVAWLAVTMVTGIGFMRDLEAGGAVDLDAVYRWNDRICAFQSKLFGVQTIGIVVFLMWVHRVASNLVGFGAGGEARRNAVVSFFVPVVNLWKPYEILSSIWLASMPRDAEPSLKAPPILLSWWLIWTISRVLSLIVGGGLGERPRASDGVILSLAGSLGAYAVEIVALLLMFAVVWRLTRLQERCAGPGLAEATVVHR